MEDRDHQSGRNNEDQILHDAGINTPVVRIGWPDEFIEHGNIPALREKHGLTPENAIQLIMEKL